jgi:hypothetical protein
MRGILMPKMTWPCSKPATSAPLRRESHRVEFGVPPWKALLTATAHAFDFGPGLLAKINKAKRRIAFGHKVIDDQDLSRLSLKSAYRW